MVRSDLDVLQPAAGIRRGAEREVEREDAHRRQHVAVMGLRGHAVGADDGPGLPTPIGCQPAVVRSQTSIFADEPPTPTTEITCVALPTD